MQAKTPHRIEATNVQAHASFAFHGPTRAMANFCWVFVFCFGLSIAMGKQGRLCPDPCVGVQEYIKAIHSFCKQEDCFNLEYFLAPNKALKPKWKSAPSPEFLAGGMAKLMKFLLQPMPNGVYSGKKMKLVLHKLQSECKRLNHSKTGDQDWYDMMDDMIRCAAKHYRDLKDSSMLWERFNKKCSEEESGVVASVLAKIDKPAKSISHESLQDQGDQGVCGRRG